MSARSRSRDDRSLQVGEIYLSTAGGQTFTRQQAHGEWKTCDDTVNQWTTENPFKLVSNHTFVPVINGTTVNGIGTVTRKYSDVPLGGNSATLPPNALSLYPEPNGLAKGALAWKILAESNPSAPSVSLPTYLAELKDLKTLPVRVRDWGGSLLRKIAQGHLTWRWAIKPMYSDFMKMYSFIEASEQRFRWIAHLSKGRPLRRRVSLGRSSHQVNTASVQRHSENFSVYYARERLDSVEEWGSSHWELAPDTAIPHTKGTVEVAKIRDLTAQTYFGITGYEALATAWELMPWSWLVDWFTDVGDIITACNNTLGLTWRSVCYMRKVDIRVSYVYNSGLPSGYSTNGVPFESTVVKQRFPVTPTLGVSPSFLPYLTTRQWSILGSLAALRYEKRK